MKIHRKMMKRRSWNPEEGVRRRPRLRKTCMGRVLTTIIIRKLIWLSLWGVLKIHKDNGLRPASMGLRREAIQLTGQTDTTGCRKIMWLEGVVLFNEEWIRIATCHWTSAADFKQLGTRQHLLVEWHLQDYKIEGKLIQSRRFWTNTAQIHTASNGVFTLNIETQAMSKAESTTANSPTETRTKSILALSATQA